MKHELTIIIVGYNEEINLPTFFSHLEYIRGQLSCRIIYVDQSSTDSSIEIVKNNNCELYIHSNKGYADPDKKRAFDTLCESNDWCMILDCDERLLKDISDEIITIVRNNIKKKYVYKMKRVSIILGGYGGEAYETRLFIKKYMSLSDEIHNYIHPLTSDIGIFTSKLITEDLKYKNQEIKVFIEKLNRYSDKEIEKLYNIKKYIVMFNLLWKPLQWFFGFGIIHKQFLRGTKGLIICSLMAYYQRSIYAKLYEKKYIK